MARNVLNAANLEALGAQRLAALLLEISADSPVAKRRLRLELAGTESPGAVAKEVRKRLATIARSRTLVDWQNRKPLVDDLQTQRRAIREQVARQAPAEALELMWRFLDLADSVFARSNDSSGAIEAVFDTAVDDLAEIAVAAKPDPKQLADQVFAGLTQNHYGHFAGLIRALKPVLQPSGLQHLKQRLVALQKQPVQKLAAKDRKVVAWGVGGPLYAEEIAERSRRMTIEVVLTQIADAQGDVDGFIKQHSAKARKVPRVAAEIAQRLIAADRVEEALAFLQEAEPHQSGDFPDFEWEDARIAALEALGRGAEAQAARWSCFERYLSARHLRDYLKRLQDFDDFEAEQRALDFTEQAKDLLAALQFLIEWPALDRAARLAVQRAAELDGNRYEVLTPAADALAGKYPLAATLLLRAMTDFTLKQSRATRYGHAARHLRTCAGLAAAIPDYGTFETHDAYVARLHRVYGNRTAFWRLAD